MNVSQAAWILKNELSEVTNYGEAVETIRINRIVRADFTLRTEHIQGERVPVWEIQDLTVESESSFEKMTLYRRAEEHLKDGLFWTHSPWYAWFHTIGFPGQKMMFYAEVSPSAILAEITYRGTPSEFIIDTTNLDIQLF